MQKTTLTIFLIALFFQINVFSQFELRINGNLITEDTEFAFSELSTLTDATSEIEFVLTNPSTTETIYVELEVMSIVNNTTGGNVQLCWGLCDDTISVGHTAPPTAETLTPGSSTASLGNHFRNLYAGDDTNVPVIYTLRFRQVTTGGVETGTPINITYKYDSSLSIDDNKLKNVKVYPTLAKDFLYVETMETVEMKIYDVLGKNISTYSISQGTNAIDISTLKSQIYYVILKNSLDKQFITKIILN